MICKYPAKIDKHQFFCHLHGVPLSCWKVVPFFLKHGFYYGISGKLGTTVPERRCRTWLRIRDSTCLPTGSPVRTAWRVYEKIKLPLQTQRRKQSNMKNILVPVDFSSTAQNSALYAASLARKLGATKLVLYNAYSMPLATEMSWAVLQTEELQKASEEGLANNKAQLEKICGGDIEIQTVSDFGFLAERIDTIAHNVNADLIVMGITGGGKLEEVLMGSNTTHVVHHTTIPLLIVPADAKWKDVEVIGWSCDYKDVIKTTPAQAIGNFVNALNARLVIMHNNPDPKAFDPELFHNNVMVAEMFKKIKPEFDLVSYDNFLDATHDFVERHKVDMLLVIPKKTGWFESLFKRSHTKMLAFHSHIPILCLRSLAQ